MRKLVYTGVILLLVLAGAELSGDVFWRFSGRHGQTALSALGGRTLYQTGVEINGSAGELQLLVFDKNSRETVADLTRLWNLPAGTTDVSTMITHADATHLHRVLVLPAPNSYSSCLVMALVQRTREAQKSAQSVPVWPSDIPVLPAQPLFTAQCVKTRTTLVTAWSNSSSTELRNTALQILQTKGWELSLPSNNLDHALLSRGREQCMVFVNEDGRGASTITILQRRGKG